MTKLSELMPSPYIIPAAGGAVLGLALFLGLWWRERRGGGFALLMVGLAWGLCHLIVNPNSYAFRPGDSADWLVFGGLALVPVAGVAWVRGRGTGVAAVVAGLVLAVVSWLALQKFRWFLERGETPRELWLWTSGIISAVLAAFGAAEAAARRVPAIIMMASLAIFTALAAVAMVQLTMPERTTARLLAVTGLAGGAAVAGLVHHWRRQAPGLLSPGVAGWLAGGTVLLFVLACLSRVPGVPLLPMGIAAAALPAAALLVYTCGRILGGSSPVFLAVLLVSGAAVAWFSGQDRAQLAETSAPAATGADDTGAYDGL
jgi:hypothetical protein